MNKLLDAIKTNKYEFIFFLMFGGTFLTPYYTRYILCGEKLAGINAFTIIGIVVLLYMAIIHETIMFDYKKWDVICLICLICLFVFVQTIYSDKSFLGSARYFFSIIFPIVLIYFKLEKEVFDKIFRLFVRIIDILIFVMLIMLLIDICFNNFAIKFFATLTNAEIMHVYSNTSRHASIMGHFLTTAQTYIVFYIVHVLEMKMNNNYKYNLLYICISLFGVCMASSKSGILILVILFIVCNIKNKQVIFGGSILTVTGLAVGVFDNLINRFLTTDLTSGRIERLLFLSSNYNLFPLIGHGAYSSYDFNDVISWASAAFEFPVVMFSYEYGVIFTILFYYLVFINPFYKLLKNKNYFLFILLLMLALFVNFFNGIGMGYDNLYIYTFVTFIVLNVSENNVIGF